MHAWKESLFLWKHLTYFICHKTFLGHLWYHFGYQWISKFYLQHLNWEVVRHKVYEMPQKENSWLMKRKIVHLIDKRPSKYNDQTGNQTGIRTWSPLTRSTDQFHTLFLVMLQEKYKLACSVVMLMTICSTTYPLIARFLGEKNVTPAMPAFSITYIGDIFRHAM